MSVLLPFRNAAATLDAAVVSIATQTFTPWELLLIDNASADAGADIARQWAMRDERIHLVHEPRTGIAHALNKGLRTARGRYIARMDADDISLPERLERQIAHLDAHPEIGVLGTRTRFVTTVEKSSGMAWFVNWQNTILDPHMHYVKRFVDVPLAHPSVVFRRELVDEYGGYDTGPIPEDHELWLRWMDAGVRFAKLPEVLVEWRDHAARLSRTHPHYTTEAFFALKAKWIARWLDRKYHGQRPVIIAGTSGLCVARARLLEQFGVRIHAFTDVRTREVEGYRFIPAIDLPGHGKAVIVSMISQRGTGDRIAEFLTARGLVEGRDLLLAA
ncbi:MAG: glycosyltransferase [Flavobacteriales bacterium]|nr:glycosyltransferase [Flavobacteriales bacterium]MCB9167008.1 glycosyltransferase [Flavobacteriales bacterium]